MTAAAVTMRLRTRPGASRAVPRRAPRPSAPALARLATVCLLSLLAPRPALAQLPAGFRPLRPDGGGVEALTRPVSVVLDDVTVAEAVRAIARDAGVDFTYAARLPELDRRISLHSRESSAAAALLNAIAGTRLAIVVGPAGQLVLIRAAADPPSGAIRGQVRERGSGEPIGGARIDAVPATAPGRRTVYSGDDGAFVLDRLAPGDYALEVSGLGLASTTVAGVRPVVPGQASLERELTVVVERRPLELAAIIVAPGHFGLLAQDPAAQATLTRDEVRSRPQLGEDLFRAINRLPGISSADMAAPFHVRGGGADELYVTLDGMELYEPFHLKDLEAALSILDLQSVSRIDLTEGGATADVGNRLTGALAIHSLEPTTDRPATTLAASITGIRGQSLGSFAGGRGGWLVSARRGYLDLAFRMTGVGDSLSPRYHDVFAKAYYDVAPGQRLTLHALQASDGLHYANSDGDLNTGYGSAYLWGTWEVERQGGVRLETLASAGRLTWHRAGIDNEPNYVLGDVADDRSFRFAGLRHDGAAPLGTRLLVRWGGEARALAADYDYHSIVARPTLVDTTVQMRPDSLAAALEPRGAQLGGYLSARVRLADPLVVEGGVRADHQGYTGETQVTPRLNLVLTPARGTTIRAAWGRHAQPEPIAALQVQDGERAFGAAEQATQVVAGIEQRLGRGLTARAEAYRRDIGRERARWISLGPSSDVPLFPETQDDRVRIAATSGRARGLELFLRATGTRFDGAVSYALAEARDVVGGVSVPRPLDQRHTVYLDATWHPADDAWRISVAWQTHSGWPEVPISARLDTVYTGGRITGLTVARSYGLPTDARLPWYHRLDLRATRTFKVGRGRLAAYADVFNVLNSLNYAGYKQSLAIARDGTAVSYRHYSRQVPRLPSAGLSWEF